MDRSVPELVSVIVPCFNDKDYVKQTIDSIRLQTYDPIELILVDDGSDVSTKDLIKSVSHKIDIVITQENNGQSAARNVGIEKASGSLILMIDSDDFIEPNFVKEAIAKFRTDNDIKIVSSNVNLIYEDPNIEDIVYKPTGGDISDFLFANSSSGCIMMRKSDWSKAGGYDESMRKGWEDWEFYIRILKEGGRCHVIDQTLFNYRKRKKSTTSIANSHKFDLYEYIFNKHKDMYIQNYQATISFLTNKMRLLDIDSKTKSSSLEYHAGKVLLKPLKMIRSLFS